MSRYGIIVNVDRCAGCFACAVACKEENPVSYTHLRAHET